MSLEQHPLSAAYPPMPEEELQALAGDIEAHGLHSAIVIYQGKVIDGWHRALACRIAGVNPRMIEYKGGDPRAFVESANEHRRHMTASQRALAKVALNDWRPEGGQQSTPPNGGVGSAGESAPPNGGVKSTAEMASEAHVGTRTIERAKEVHKHGSDALKEAVREGKIPVHKAADIAKLPKPQQDKALAEPKQTAKPKKKDDAAPKGEEFAPDLVAELERADKEIRSLQGLVESLKTSDLALEVSKWYLKFDQLDGRLRQCMTTAAESAKQAKYQGALLTKIRKALRVEKNSQILPAIAK